MQVDIEQVIFDSPELTAALVVVIYGLVKWQRGLSYREYRTAHLIKSRLFRLLDDRATAAGRPLIRSKGKPEDDPEYITTVPYGPRETYNRLRQAGASPHLIATTKRRVTDDGYQYSHSQLVRLNDDGTQTEWYLFPAAGGTDIYGHRETAVTDPEGHVGTPQDAATLPEDLDLG